MSCAAEIRVVVLKRERLAGDSIRKQVWDVWPNAVVEVFQQGLDALSSMQESKTDLLISGAKIDDMDGLEHLEPFIQRPVPILIVTSRADQRMFEMLRRIRYDGIFDGHSEGLESLPGALRCVMQGRKYVSPALLPFLQEKKNITLDELTERERVILSVIGDGTDNKEASKLLGISQWTVLTHRERIMRKLGLHHSRELMQYMLVNGHIVITAKGLRRAGYERWLARLARHSFAADDKPRRRGRRPKSEMPDMGAP
jgi:DNA-binding NarL/FixJ family response regulator